MELRAGQLVVEADAVVFDKDGTLIDLDVAWGGITLAWVAGVVQEAVGVADDTLFAYLIAAVGVTPDGRFVPDGIAAVEPTSLVADTVEAELQRRGLRSQGALAALRRGSYDVGSVRFEPIGDVEGALERLSSTGLGLAVATSDHREPTLASLDLLGWARHFGSISCGDDPHGAKPSAAVLHHVASELGTSASRLVMVGDSAGDMSTGRNAGAAANIAIIRPDGSVAEGADAAIESIDELDVG